MSGYAYYVKGRLEEMEKIILREMKQDDLPRFREWLYSPHVAKWYHDPGSWIEEVEKQDSEFRWVHHFMVEADGRSVGFCQYYACGDSDELWQGYTDMGGSYSIDYLIGDKEYLRKGVGRQIVQQLAEKIKLHDDAERIVVEPERENKASCGLLSSCGFIFDGEKGIYVYRLREKKLVLKQDIITALRAAGMRTGQTVMVHTSLSRLGFVCGGAQTVIEALLECAGEEGTIMMPSQSWKNLDPSAGVHWEEPREWWQAIRDNWPAYNKEITPTNTMGATAEMFRKWPGTVRSDHPARSAAARGRYGEYLTRDHDLSDIFGDSSPVGKLYELDGYVLLMGVGYDKNTSLHLADVRAEYPGRHMVQESSAVMMEGKRVWKTYQTLYVDGEDFEQIGAAFEKEREVAKVPLGSGVIRFMRQRELVDYAVEWIEKNRNQ